MVVEKIDGIKEPDAEAPFEERALAYAWANLGQCALEILDWRRKGVLADGKLRGLEAIYESAGFHDNAPPAWQRAV